MLGLFRIAFTLWGYLRIAFIFFGLCKNRIYLFWVIKEPYLHFLVYSAIAFMLFSIGFIVKQMKEIIFFVGTVEGLFLLSILLLNLSAKCKPFFKNSLAPKGAKCIKRN